MADDGGDDDGGENCDENDDDVSDVEVVVVLVGLVHHLAHYSEMRIDITMLNWNLSYLCCALRSKTHHLEWGTANCICDTGSVQVTRYSSIPT